MAMYVRSIARRWPAVMVLAFAGALGSACASAHAKTKLPEASALDAPPPPPRVIAPLDTEAAAPVAPAPEEPIKQNLPPRSPTRTNRDAPGTRGELAKTEPPKPDVEVPKPTEGPEAPPVHRLQPANEADQERSILTRLAAAERDLLRIDYQKLSSQLKNQYDTAKRFVEQAKEALKSRNFVFADSLSEKAATLAASLKSP